MNTEYVKCQEYIKCHINNAMLIKIKYNNIASSMLTITDLVYIGSSLSLEILVTPEPLDGFCEFFNLYLQGSVCLLSSVTGGYLGLSSCLPSVIT